jgi:predicted NBD/HSP70 family sugar kinase
MSGEGEAKSQVGLTIGVDVEDRVSQMCVLDADGEIQEEARIRTTPSAFGQWFRSAPSRKRVG